MTDELNLSQVFGEVSRVLAQNRQQLDDADGDNHNHGTNIVNTFNLIQQAVESKQTQPASDQLAYASQVLKKQSTGSTAQIYADGLARASTEFVGKDFNAATAGTLINSLMGTAESTERGSGDFLSSLLGSLSKPKEEPKPAPAQPNDLFSSLIGNLTGQQQTPAAPASTPAAGDLLGMLGGLTGGTAAQTSSGGIGDLVGSLLGGQSASSQTSGLDAKDLLSAGLAYYAAKQSGQSNLQAIMQAIGSSSAFGNRPDQQQSGALVVNTILNMLGNK